MGRGVWPGLRTSAGPTAGPWPSRTTLVVLQAAGRHVLGHLGATVVAITGSVGKTTTKDILVAMLEAAGVAAQGTPGNQNTEVGVPLAMLGLRDDVDVAVVEMGMRGEGQIAELVRLAPPDVACITSVAPVHLELLRTIENIAAAKAEILTGLRPGGTAVVPAGEALLDRFVDDLPPGVEVMRFGDDVPNGVDIALDKAWQRRNAAAAARAAWRWTACPTRAPRGGGAVGHARAGAAPAGGRHADRGLLQRQPGRDGGRAARPGPPRRAQGGGAGRHARAGPRRAPLPPRPVGAPGPRPGRRPAGGRGRPGARLRGGRRWRAGRDVP